ncbi:MAG: hypothetical protein KAQ83_02965 [Nanoarchaeota archaeon]|nr:hypothetical protein [Nanoarchaeota archaeon]
MDVEGLTKLVKKYEYGQFNLLDGNFEISYNPITDVLTFDPLYRHGTRPTSGTCAELMATAYLEIPEKFPGIHLTRVLCRDPIYFNDEGDPHSGLLASEKDLMPGEIVTNNPEVIEKVNAQNPLLIDPSLQMVKPLLESGYSIHMLTNPSFKLEYFNSHSFGLGGNSPLGFDSKGNLVHLIANPYCPSMLMIGIQTKNKCSKPYDLGSRELDVIFKGDETMQKFISVLREKEIVPGMKDLEPKEIIRI